MRFTFVPEHAILRDGNVVAVFTDAIDALTNLEHQREEYKDSVCTYRVLSVRTLVVETYR